MPSPMMLDTIRAPSPMTQSRETTLSTMCAPDPIVLPSRMMLFSAIAFVSRRAPSYRQELSAMLPFPRNTAGPT